MLGPAFQSEPGTAWGCTCLRSRHDRSPLTSLWCLRRSFGGIRCKESECGQHLPAWKFLSQGSMHCMPLSVLSSAHFCGARKPAPEVDGKVRKTKSRPFQHAPAGSLVLALGPDLLEALHSSPAVQKNSLALAEACGRAAAAARERAPPEGQLQQRGSGTLRGLTLLAFASDGLPKRTPVQSFLF